jgi:hypothetical protein
MLRLKKLKNVSKNRLTIQLNSCVAIELGPNETVWDLTLDSLAGLDNLVEYTLEGELELEEKKKIYLKS